MKPKVKRYFGNLATSDNTSSTCDWVYASDYDALSQQLAKYQRAGETGQSLGDELDRIVELERQLIEVKAERDGLRVPSTDEAILLRIQLERLTLAVAAVLEMRETCNSGESSAQMEEALDNLAHLQDLAIAHVQRKPCTCQRFQFPHRRTSECLSHAP